jgi:hypothetical protein
MLSNNGFVIHNNFQKLFIVSKSTELHASQNSVKKQSKGRSNVKQVKKKITGQVHVDISLF